MSAIALMIEPGQLVGFLFLANAAALQAAPATSDCIFTGVPKDEALLDHPLGRFVQDRKHVEYTCHVEKDKDDTLIRLNTPDGASVYIRLDAAGHGQWEVEDRSTKHAGVCQLAKKQNG